MKQGRYLASCVAREQTPCGVMIGIQATIHGQAQTIEDAVYNLRDYVNFRPGKYKILSDITVMDLVLDAKVATVKWGNEK